MTTETDQERAKDQARAQLESIVEMVKRLEHVRSCDGEGCELTDAEVFAGINIYYKDGMIASEEDRGQYHNEDEARQSIEEDPVGIQVRSGWHTPGEEEAPAEYEILLCTGGPAVRITGELSQHQEPETAQIEYQDWFTPWARYGDTSDEEDEALLTYAQQFYFGS